MMNENDNLNQLFREKLWDYHKNPPEAVWDSIESRLDSGIRRKKIVRLTGIAASILFVFFLGLWSDGSFDKERESAENVITKLNSTRLESPEDLMNALPVPEKNTTHSMASLASKFTLPEKENSNSAGEELIQLDPEKEIRAHFPPNQETLNKLSALFGLSEKQDKKTTGLTNNLEELVFRMDKDQINGNKDYIASQKTELPWSFGIAFTPLFTSGIKNLPGMMTKTEVTSAAGITGKYQLSKRVELKSGLFYHHLRQETGWMKESGSTLNHTPTGTIKWNEQADFPNESNLQLKQDFGYVEIPIRIGYKVIDKKVDVGLSGGISTNILILNKASASDGVGAVQTGETTRLRDFAFAGVIGIEMAYNVSKRISITLEPQFKRYFCSMSSDPGIPINPVQLGVLAGISYSFE